MSKEELLVIDDISETDFETEKPDTVAEANAHLLEEEPAGEEVIRITRDVDDEVTKALQLQSVLPMHHK